MENKKAYDTYHFFIWNRWSLQFVSYYIRRASVIVQKKNYGSKWNACPNFAPCFPPRPALVQTNWNAFVLSSGQRFIPLVAEKSVLFYYISCHERPSNEILSVTLLQFHCVDA